MTMSGKREGASQHMYGAQIQNDAKFTSVAALVGAPPVSTFLLILNTS